MSPSPIPAPGAPARVPARAVARPSPPEPDAATGRTVAALLRDLGSQLQRGSQALARETGARLATGWPDLDRRLGGGFPPGRLSEITGPTSCGRTSLALALLARATQRGEVTAWIDGVEAFDAASAQAAGVALERVLWARPRGLREAGRCCECLLDARGFSLVVLDLAVAAGAVQAPPRSSWQRLARKAAGSGTALVVLSRAYGTGGCADLVLTLQPRRAHFTGTPALLEGLSLAVHVTRQRAGPARQVASLRLSTARRRAG